MKSLINIQIGRIHTPAVGMEIAIDQPETGRDRNKPFVYLEDDSWG